MKSEFYTGLIAMEKLTGWRKKRLSRVYDSVQTVFQMPKIFENDVTGEDAINYLREKYKIDVDLMDIGVKYE